nr:hypothetical protein [Deltaproteobacteria bacterium]
MRDPDALAVLDRPLAAHLRPATKVPLLRASSSTVTERPSKASVACTRDAR